VGRVELPGLNRVYHCNHFFRTKFSAVMRAENGSALFSQTLTTGHGAGTE
jgi:hypothetical protein